MTTKVGKNLRHIYDSVADMVANCKAKVGEKVETQGYYSPNDGGGAEYTIVAADTTLTLSENSYSVTYCGGTTATFTLPTPLKGKLLTICTLNAADVVSSSSNVSQLPGGALSTAILPATAGAWVELIADGTYWNIIKKG